jgi:uncharacterized membrane protein
MTRFLNCIGIAVATAIGVFAGLMLFIMTMVVIEFFWLTIN